MTAEAGRLTVWLIDPKHTLVEFAATYLMVTTVKGHFNGVSGTLRLDEEDLARSSVVVEIDAASLDTGEGRRDTNLRSPDFLDVERYPLVTFTSSRVEAVGSDRLLVHGDLTIRGTTRPAALDTHLKGRGRTPDGMEVVAFTAQTAIDRQDFGVRWNQPLESGGLLVGNTVDILLEVQALRQD
jgi:polyisoprenoid-binding protein YceI